ncbi:MAG: thiamine pyrophosphate-binding protein [Candidatus Latescibacterota bacterium]
MASKTGHSIVIEQLLADGIDHMFGNPGTVEEGFLDALRDYPQMRYVLTLQESVAVTIADGYARATRRPALVQLHSTPGVGNGIGALYQAMRGHAPLVVIGGDAGIRYQAMDAQMAGDLVAMAEPVTKWSTMVTDPSSLLRVLRRAIKTAATPPTGPVYVCLPLDVLDAPAVEEVRPTSIPATRVAPEPELVARAAAMLAGARRPMVYAGDGVAFSGAQESLARVAELLGAEVWEADAGEVNMSYRHPLYQGMTGHMFGYHSLPVTRRGDVNLVCGTYVLPEVFPELGPIFAPGSRCIHIDLDLDQIARNHPVDLGMLGDPQLALTALAEALEGAMTQAQRQAARERLAGLARAREERRARELEEDRKLDGAVPLHMAPFARELVRCLPPDAVVFDEALTASPALTRYLEPCLPGRYFLTRGGSLGVGFTGTIGAKLANPAKTVIGFSGDGGSMYTIQALWTAARHGLDVKFVVCNNGSYRLLQLNIDAFWQERGMARHDYPLCFDLSSPPIRFDELARGMGVPAARVERPEEIAPAIQQALGSGGPFLIDLVLEGDVHPERIGNTCGQ